MRISEIFFSVQGEGVRTGELSLFIRFFGCNLKCRGFGQLDPASPSTWKSQKIDFSKYTRLEDLPVFEYGCDSAYSWDPNYKKLAMDLTAKEVVDYAIKKGSEQLGWLGYDNGESIFAAHPQTGNSLQLVFTGGEPMLYQQEMLDIVQAFSEIGIEFAHVTVETNGTKKPNVEFPLNFDFSVSPKLHSVSSEVGAVMPEVIDELLKDNLGWLKWVVRDSEVCWNELDHYMQQIRFRGNVWIMPVGATLEQQQGEAISRIANEALRRGYKISARVQNYLFGNRIGT